MKPMTSETLQIAPARNAENKRFPYASAVMTRSGNETGHSGALQELQRGSRTATATPHRR